MKFINLFSRKKKEKDFLVKEADALEEIRFIQFMQEKKKEADRKHPNSKMAKGVSKCAVGRFWVEKDYLDLIQAIVPGVTLSDFSRATGRSFTGCISRLQMLHIVDYKSHFSSADIIKKRIYIKRLKFTMANGKLIDLSDELCKIGYVKVGSYLECPGWLENYEIK